MSSSKLSLTTLISYWKETDLKRLQEVSTFAFTVNKSVTPSVYKQEVFLSVSENKKAKQFLRKNNFNPSIYKDLQGGI